MEIWKALAYLHPTAVPRIHYVIAAVAGQPAAITKWNWPGDPPTEAEMIAASDAYDVAQATRATKRATRRARLRLTAEGAVGEDVAALNAAQRTAVQALVWEKMGILDDEGKIRPLEEWADQ